MIRHYERIGLIAPAARAYSGHRTYGARDLHTLRFVRLARGLGFSVEQIEELLSLWRNHLRSRSKVQALALAHIAELDARMRDLGAMKLTLEHLAAGCRGDERPECPILDGLGEGCVQTDHALAPAAVWEHLEGRNAFCCLGQRIDA
jgi:Cu(I)-responsive transcriptional regulator